MTEVGIKETKELVLFLTKVGASVKESLADGKVDLSDVSNFYPVLATVLPAIQGIGEVPAELKDLSSTEIVELIEKVAVGLDLSGKQAELVKAALKVIISCFELYQVFKK